MLTILAWMVFIPAVVWNILYGIVAINGTSLYGVRYWSLKSEMGRQNVKGLILSLATLIIPGVFLFGWV